MKDHIKLYEIVKKTSWKDVELTYNTFPDGQIQFYTDIANVYNKKFAVKVSIVNAEVLELLIQILSTINVETLNINYLYGARSDKDRAGNRKVTNVAEITLKQLKAAYSGSNISFLCPHCIDLVKKYFPNALLFNNHTRIMGESPSGYILLPDEGATYRINFELKESIGFCSKKRDQISGNIETLYLKTPLPKNTERVNVLDDMCDGGRTFLKIAKLEELENLPKDLFVFHGIFSNKALEKLLAVYDNIYTTDSYPFDMSYLTKEQKSRVHIV